jgi:hypothetical protein
VIHRDERKSMERATEVRGNTADAWGGKLSESRRPEISRCEPRHRGHLRHGEIADLQRRVICECLICDRSSKGARLRLPKNVSVPDQIWFHDDQVNAPVRAQVRWRRNQEIGIFIPKHAAPGASR